MVGKIGNTMKLGDRRNGTRCDAVIEWQVQRRNHRMRQACPRVERTHLEVFGRIMPVVSTGHDAAERRGLWGEVVSEETKVDMPRLTKKVSDVEPTWRICELPTQATNQTRVVRCGLARNRQGCRYRYSENRVYSARSEQQGGRRRDVSMQVCCK